MSDSQASSQPDELTTIREILVALGRFDKPAHKRILDYVHSYLGSPTSLQQPAQVVDSTSHNTVPSQALCKSENLGELISITNPKLLKEKILVAAYWIQVCKINPMALVQKT